MDRRRLAPTLALALLVVAAAAAGSAVTAFLVKPGAEAAAAAEAQNPAAPAAPVTWAVLSRVMRADADDGVGGIVAAGLVAASGDLNATVVGPPIPTEIIAVDWDARGVTAADGDLTRAFNARFETGPPLAHARGTLSRSGDAVELLLAPDLPVVSVIVHTPETRSFMVHEWPSGVAYGYQESANAWRQFKDSAPGLVARPAPE